MSEQVLDSMDLERERGITIKAQSVSLTYHSVDGQDYQLNFIDTPGHVDFSYEVSRSLAACEGALLVVDAAQGVEAQSVANCNTAIDQGLEVLSVLNKIDLPASDPEKVVHEIEDIIGVDAQNALRVSAKTGAGVPELLEYLVREIPPPEGNPDAPLQALIIDSWFDNYVGVVSLVRVINGRLPKKTKITVMSTGRSYSADRVGCFTPKMEDRDALETGEVGFVIAGIKDIYGAPVGDTLTATSGPCDEPLSGFKQIQPRVFAGLFPISSDDYENFRDALQKLRLNDAALHFEPETSAALGFGFRCGFLGMLHMEIVQERLEREYNLELITTAPTVVFEVELADGQVINVDNPSKLPPPNEIVELREPIILTNILVPEAHVGSVMKLCIEKRGVQKQIRYLGSQVSLEYELPLAEVVLDFFDRLKSVSRGFASFDYQLVIRAVGGLQAREMSEQVLDSMDLERERGITIKAQSVSLTYHSVDGQDYQLNFIDTPGHVDFSYEVSRSLAACEGALLVVDAAQGVEAQSVANCNTAIDQGLEVLSVLNKIDLPASDPEKVVHEIEDIIGVDAQNALRVSAKTGAGVPELLEYLVREIPPPEGNPDAPLQALIIDSWFDNYVGVVSLVRVINGRLPKKTKITVMSTGRSYSADRVGCFTPKMEDRDALETGEVGFVIAGIKDIYGAPVGDTLTATSGPCDEPLSGFKQIQPRVFAGLFPISSDDYENFRDALQKLRLNDAALHFEPETSAALGFGFRCGFLGMLHMEIVQERLEREYNLELITTAPTVVFEVELADGQVINVDNPSKLPPPNEIVELREPIILTNILVPEAHVGSVMKLCIEKRGVQKQIRYLGSQVSLEYELPLAEVVLDFFDRLKSVSRGFASFDYQLDHFEAASLARLDVLINKEKVDALSIIIHRDKATIRGRELVEKMRELIPRQMFDVSIQAAIGGKVIARSNVKALRKNVTAKCYGGDISRKRKLLEKQKAGKKRMKSIGSVDIPQKAFLAVLETGEEEGKKKG